ncbi:MAG: hypothetical protein QMD14_03150 [Candidatus Aenigmarchaeota archaeon]|nr:hypothetical protein [Candidatus Aenigmarchaeota archaeon]
MGKKTTATIKELKAGSFVIIDDVPVVWLKILLSLLVLLKETK